MSEQTIRDAIVAAYEAGTPAKDIAREHHRSTVRVYDVLRAAGVLRPQGPRQLTDDQVRELRRRYQAGESSTVLGAELGLSREAIRQALTGRTYGYVPGPVPMRKQGTPSLTAAERAARIVRMGREGAPVGAITAAFGDSRARVLAVLTEAGIEPVVPPRRSRGSVRTDNKLVEADVVAARRRYRAGTTTAALARQFGISHVAMTRALRGSTWAHVPHPVTDEEWRGMNRRAPSPRATDGGPGRA